MTALASAPSPPRDSPIPLTANHTSVAITAIVWRTVFIGAITASLPENSCTAPQADFVPFVISNHNLEIGDKLAYIKSASCLTAASRILVASAVAVASCPAFAKASMRRISA